MKQTDRILEYLVNNGSIDPLQSWYELGVYRLSARIEELRKTGAQIETSTKVVYNKFGEPCRVAEYVLVVL